jgi:SAM-dependent methyltransferase
MLGTLAPQAAPAPAPSNTRAPRAPLPPPAKQQSTGERGVVECYSGPFHRIVYKGAGLAGYNEGRYADNPTRPHDEAHRLQNKKIIEMALFGREGGKWKGADKPRLLDVGCGNGDLLDVARSMGVEAVGITLVPTQVEECRKRGLTAYVLNYRDIGPEWAGQFDGVCLKGSVEHFVQPADVMAGKDAAIYHELFEILARTLDPQSESGRICNSTIHFTRRPDPRELVASPFAHPTGSDAYHYSMLHHMYNGWQPVRGELAERAKPFFVLEHEEDISLDYRLSAEFCLGVIKKAAMLRPRMWWEATLSFVNYPKSTLTHAWGLYVSQSTNWYFRGKEPPCEGLLQTWKHVNAS